MQQPAAAPADVEEYQHIDNIFSLKRPRDIRAGLSSGAKSAAKGIALGTAGLFAAPIFGAYTDGVKGFAQGVGAGELNMLVLSRNSYTGQTEDLCLNPTEMQVLLGLCCCL